MALGVPNQNHPVKPRLPLWKLFVFEESYQEQTPEVIEAFDQVQTAYAGARATDTWTNAWLPNLDRKNQLLRQNYKEAPTRKIREKKDTMALPTVAIVGRPNVGKSTLFNRIAGERISIVEDVEGVTRDRIYATAEWLNHQFSIIDTGGIDDVDAPFMEQIKHQAEIAMDEADVIVFVVSGKEGITDADEYVARMLYKTHKPVILAVNKVDNPEMRTDIYDFYALGLGEPLPVSSVHGIGTGDVLDAIVENLPTDREPENPDVIKFSLIGRPNVGKSSLINAILGKTASLPVLWLERRGMRLTPILRMRKAKNTP